MPASAKPPALDPARLSPRVGSSYPAPFDRPCRQREKRVLGDPLGLTQFGVNLTALAPGPGRRSAIGTGTRTSSFSSSKARSP